MAQSELQFPAGLLDWAGHRSGGVRRMFDEASGRPSGAIIRTRLLDRLTRWVDDLVVGSLDAPRTVLLVGGPGNGKTEAVEVMVAHLDDRLALDGTLMREAGKAFTAPTGQPVPRVVSVDLAGCSGGRLSYQLHIVQDASVTDASHPGKSPAELLLLDLANALDSPATLRLCCVNRGVLDDALILAIDRQNQAMRTLLETIVRAVGLSPSAPACWPLDGHPRCAIWPMDVESLFVPLEGGHESPAAQLIDVATSVPSWPAFGSCAAGNDCPFCTSRNLMSSEPHRGSLLKILRWHELASGKRWSFRDLFSLMSYLLAGEPMPEGVPVDDPCAWAARQRQLVAATGGHPDSLKTRAPFLLVAAQYQHALFNHWPREGARALRQDLKELNLDDDATLMGLYHFLHSHRALSIPGTLRPQLESICDALDPALADPDGIVAVSNSTEIKFRDLDERFSQSTREGLAFVRKYRCLSRLEVDLLTRLAASDERLSSAEVRKRRPAVASRVQALVREFSCRLVRRSVGVRSAVVLDADTLDRYEKLIDGAPAIFYDAVRHFSKLLHSREHFVVSLNTTFGEPLPPEPRRAVLTTRQQQVRSLHQQVDGRPAPAMRFLAVGSSTPAQPIPLTYELFRSVGALRAGMLPASLPRTVVALLDTTRARLAGQVVRDGDTLEDAELKIGLREDVIAQQLGQFVVRQEGPT